MLSYTFDKNKKTPLYEQLYGFIKEDITAGRLSPGEKLPGKRPLSEHLGISVITVENAYAVLAQEGYIKSMPRKGFFVEELVYPNAIQNAKNLTLDFIDIQINENNKIGSDIEEPKFFADLNSNSVPAQLIPLKSWAKISKDASAYMIKNINTNIPTGGSEFLRKAICSHLYSFRGIQAHPEQLVVGAGSEYLYSLIAQLFGMDATFALEDPGYKKLANIYRLNGANCIYSDLYKSGEILSEITNDRNTSIAHVSPSHHFPTGRIMPVSTRLKLLAWAKGGRKRYIIEDDYDAEFRFNSGPVPSLFGMDDNKKTIYINTFSKTISPQLRISYMILPPALARFFNEKLGFLSCTVSLLNQYILAEFLNSGYFEKHLNRARTYYRRIRNSLIKEIRNSELSDVTEILEESSGLHFLLRIKSDKSDAELTERLKKEGVNINALSSFYSSPSPGMQHIFLIKYQGLPEEKIKETVKRIANGLKQA